MTQPPGESGTAAHYASLSPMSRHDTLQKLDFIAQPHEVLILFMSLTVSIRRQQGQSV